MEPGKPGHDGRAWVFLIPADYASSNKSFMRTRNLSAV